MKKILIGDTGLIGTTLLDKIEFDYKFNSLNINTFNQIVPNNCELYLCCLPATKWLVNLNLENDMDNIHNIMKILSSKVYNKIFLFSTIDVYMDNCSKHSNEDSYIPFKKLSYGTNRLIFELLVKNELKYYSLKIFRLPALFSSKIKKNILYDLLNNNKLENINKNTYFQWYNLNNLIDDVYFYDLNYPSEETINLFTEPIDTIELIKLTNHNENIFIDGESWGYDFHTKFYSSGYCENKDNIIKDIKKLIDEYRIK